MNIRKIALCLFGLTTMSLSVTAQPVKISSPDGKIELQVVFDKKVSAKLYSGGQTVMEIDEIGLETDKGLLPSAGTKVRRVQKNSVNRVIKPVIREKRTEIPERYNEATVEFNDKTKLQFRVYNDGMAYRFILGLPGEIKIIKDNAAFIFDKAVTLGQRRIFCQYYIAVRMLSDKKDFASFQND